MRVNAPFYVKLGLNTADFGTKWEENIAKNISECGLAITTARDYPIGAVIKLLLRIPTQPTLDWVDTFGKIIDCEKIMDSVYITRIDFCDLDPSIKDAIKRYVDWASKK